MERALCRCGLFTAYELIAYNGLKKRRLDFSYWRTITGLEVDFVINNAEVAIEVKISQTVHLQDIKGLLAFCEEHQPKKAIVVSLDAKPRLLKVNGKTEITILPWEIFLQQLWAGEII